MSSFFSPYLSSRFPRHNLSFSLRWRRHSRAEEGGFNAGRRRRGAEGDGGPHFTSEWVCVDNTSIKLFFLHPKPSRSPSKATPREEKGSRVQQPMRKSPAFSHSHEHTLSRTLALRPTECYRHRKHWFFEFTLSISISGKIWHLSAMSHHPPPLSSSPAPKKYGERGRLNKNAVSEFEFLS